MGQAAPKADSAFGMESLLSHAIVRTDTPRPEAPVPRAPGERTPAPANAEVEIPQPRGAKVLGVQAVGVVAQRPFAATWRARFIAGPNRGRPVALVIVSESASVAVRERFASVAEDLLAASGAVSGILRVQAVAPSRDAYVADLWTTGTAKDLSALRWSLRRRLEFVGRVAQALETLHTMGLVHGCLCAENVLLDDDLRPVLSEVGLVTPAVVGDTPSYADFASPEVKSGAGPDVRDDVFSAGRLLQEVVRGDETPELLDVVRTCLAPPMSRYASAADFERALNAVAERLPNEDDAGRVSLAGRPPSESRPGPIPSGSRPPPPLRERNTRPDMVALPTAGATRESALNAVGRPSPLFGGAGLLAVVLGVAGAFALGGADSTVRVVFATCLAAGAAAATWLLPSVPRAPAVVRLALAGACAALFAVIDPLATIYATVAQHHLRGSEASRRAAIEEIMRLGRDFRGLSLSGIDLAELDLTGADLRGADLSRADVSHTRLWGAEIEGASFEGARLEGADLDHTNLARARLGGATCDASTRLPAGWRCVDSLIVR
mgnify:CR=1 FL=1